MPRYLQRFSCLGSACEDNCCSAGWEVDIDAATYSRYRRCEDSRLGPILRQHVVAVSREKGDVRGPAAIQLDQAGRCPFLDSDSLCGLQVQAGADFLSRTCLNYPRCSTRVGNRIERTARLSCPEAARLALLAPDAMELVEIREPTSVRMDLSEVPANLPPGSPVRLYPELRHASAGLLAVSTASIEARLLALGLILRTLSGRPALSREDVLQAFDQYLAALPAIEAQLSAVQPADSLRIELLRELIVERFATVKVGQRYTSVAAKIERGLDVRADRVTEEGVVDRYKAALRDFYQPYMAERPWLLGNLLVNHVLVANFPFGLHGSLFDQYVLFVVRYALIKLHLVGVAASEQRLTDADLIEVIYVLERMFDHDKSFLEHIVDLLRKNDLSSMAFMAILIVS